MSKRFENIFKSEKPKTKLVSYFVGCYPDPDTCFELIKKAIDNGVSIIEIGYCTSEASSEGPVIKAAQDRVIANGSSLKDVINLAKEVRNYNNDVGIILMGYISNLFMFSITNFVKEIKKIDVDGVLVGGASLKIKDFLAIYGSAVKHLKKNYKI